MCTHMCACCLRPSVSACPCVRWPCPSQAAPTCVLFEEMLFGQVFRDGECPRSVGGMKLRGGEQVWMGHSPMALPRKKGAGCWHPGALVRGAGWTCWVVAVGKSCQKREGMELGLEEEEIGKRLVLARFHFTFYWKLLLSFPCFEGGGKKK